VWYNSTNGEKPKPLSDSGVRKELENKMDSFTNLIGKMSCLILKHEKVNVMVYYNHKKYKKTYCLNCRKEISKERIK